MVRLRQVLSLWDIVKLFTKRIDPKDIPPALRDLGKVNPQNIEEKTEQLKTREAVRQVTRFMEKLFPDVVSNRTAVAHKTDRFPSPSGDRSAHASMSSDMKWGRKRDRFLSEDVYRLYPFKLPYRVESCCGGLTGSAWPRSGTIWICLSVRPSDSLKSFCLPRRGRRSQTALKNPTTCCSALLTGPAMQVRVMVHERDEYIFNKLLQLRGTVVGVVGMVSAPSRT
jgi:hypothetical protein